jgi:hypothetical protein
MQHRKPQKPTVFFRFGKPGHGLLFLSAGAWRVFLINACKIQNNNVSLQRELFFGGVCVRLF